MTGLLALLLLANALTGCCLFNDDNRFQGQGELIVKECWPFQNYEVDLGSWQPDETVSVRRTFSGLAEMDWLAGFAVDNPDRLACPDLRDSSAGDVVVELTLKRNRLIVLTERAALRDWVWTWGGEVGDRCYVYSRETYFTATHSEQYELLATAEASATPAPRLFLYVKTYAVYTP